MASTAKAEETSAIAAVSSLDVRSRSPPAVTPMPNEGNDGSVSLQLVNLPEQGPNMYTYHYGPEATATRGRTITKQSRSVWDPRGGGAFAVRTAFTGGSSGSLVWPPDAVHGGTTSPDAVLGDGGEPDGAPGDSGDGAPDAGGNGGGGYGGGGPPPWDPDACSLQNFAGASPVTVRFAEVVSWRQRVVYCRADCTVEHVKWAMRQTVGQDVSTYRISDGFSGHPLARHWHVTGPVGNAWQNFQEPRRVLVVVPSFM
jgi:hypothetical protein